MYSAWLFFSNMACHFALEKDQEGAKYKTTTVAVSLRPKIKQLYREWETKLKNCSYPNKTARENGED
jgi:hypothetical protein